MVHCQSDDLGLSRINFNFLHACWHHEVYFTSVSFPDGRTDGRTHPLAQYLVDGGALFHFALSHHLGPLVSHVQHEGVERLLDVGLPLVLPLLLGVGRRPTARGGSALAPRQRQRLTKVARQAWAHPGWQLLLLLPGSCLTPVCTTAEWETDDLVEVGTRRGEKPPDTRLGIKTKRGKA